MSYRWVLRNHENLYYIEPEHYGFIFEARLFQSELEAHQTAMKHCLIVDKVKVTVENV